MGLSLPAVHNQPDGGWVCEICQNKKGNKIHSVREMMLGFRDKFRYLECEACGCLQLLNPPRDMARYYPSDYTAFCGNERSQIVLLQRIRHYLRKRRNQSFLKRQDWFGRLLARRYDHLQLKAFVRIGARQEARILDVGCGSGTFLMDLKELGYENLLGVDRFIPQSIACSCGVRVMKGALEDLVGTSWDVIMFHHSFEHMPDPARVLQRVVDLLAPGGRCLIRIPVVGWAWKHYGVNWVQLDAPRHLFLHTETSLRMLAGAVGLDVQNVSYDSNEYQFWVSELYMRDVTLASVRMRAPRNVFSKSTLRDFRSRAARLNSERRGDAAVFELIKL